MRSNTTRTKHKQIVVDLADMKTSNDSSGVLSTYVLGSCVAVAIYDPEARVGGLLHFIMPESVINVQKALQNPYIFADSGIPLLFRSAYRLGAAKERIVCRLAGASNVLDPEDVFNVGRLNHKAATNVLIKNNVRVSKEYVGGLAGMTLTMHIGTGLAEVIKPNGEKIQL
jgi:chemotaxis protein CheD